MGPGMIVVDANVLAYFFIEGKKTDLARRVREKDPKWGAPELWRHEFLNILVTQCLFTKLPLETAQRIWTDAEDMLRGSEFASDAKQVLPKAVETSTTAYDAEYAVLAQTMGVLCVTEDGPLQKAFPGTAVSMSTFLGLDEPAGVVRDRGARYSTRSKR